MQADRVDARGQMRALRRDDRARPQHGQDARGHLIGVMQHRAGLAAVHQQAILGIGAVGKYFAGHARVKCPRGALFARCRK